MITVTDRPRTRLSGTQLRQRLRAARRRQARQTCVARRRQARKARVARRQLERIHDRLPEPVRTLFDPLQPTFSRTVHRRFILLALAAILTLGGRTITNLLRVLTALAPGHQSSYHHVFSRDRWSLVSLARRYTQNKRDKKFYPCTMHITICSDSTRGFYCPEAPTPVAAPVFRSAIADPLSSLGGPHGSGHPDPDFIAAPRHNHPPRSRSTSRSNAPCHGLHDSSR